MPRAALIVEPVELLAERADGLFRVYVEKLHHAQVSLDMSDWFEVGTSWKAFSLAANEAEIDPRAFRNPYGDPP